MTLPAGYAALDLAFDPTTQRFAVLASNNTQVQLLSVDPSTGATATQCVTAAVSADGLDRRSDGVLTFEVLQHELVLVHRDGGSTANFSAARSVRFL